MKKSNKKVYLLSLLIPIVSMVLIFFTKNIFPFGDRSFLRTDMYHQYAPFFSELQFKLKNFDSLFFTWDLGLGTNFLTIIAYYLSCPLNVLLIFIPKAYVIDFMSYLIILKIGLSGLSMSIYLNLKYNNNNKNNKTNSNLCISLFSIFYAMSGYIAAYSWNIMWLDAVILLPLFILGLERITFENSSHNIKSILLYIISLSLIIMSNYYIATMVCIFAILYFIVINIISNDKKIKIYLKRIFRFIVYSLISALIASIILIPVIFAFNTTASSDVSFPTKWTEYFSILEILVRHLPNVEIENGLEHWPNIFCGVATLFFLLLFMISKKISIKEKITYGLFLILLYASFALNYLNFFWHFFHFPNSLPARQSFVYIFIVIILSYKAFYKIKTFTTKEIQIAFGIIISLILLLQHTVNNSKTNFSSYYLAIIFMTLYFILIYLYKEKKKFKEILFIIAISLVFLESTLNMGITSVTTTSRSAYLDDNEDVYAMKDYIKQNENSFYRIEKMQRKTKDDGAFMNFPSASIFSSSAYGALSDFYKKIGCEAAMNAYSITGSTPFVNALFSIKYALYTGEAPNVDILKLKLLSFSGNTYLYENRNTLPLAFVLKNEDLEKFDKSSANPATIQNNLSRSFGGGKGVLDKQEINEVGTSVDFTTKEAGDYYVFVRDMSIEEVYVNTPTTQKTFKNVDRGFFLELGYLPKGSDVNMKNQKKGALDFKCEVFRFNYDTLKSLVDNIQINSNFTLQKWESNTLEYNIDALQNGTLFMSIPYDKGWTIYVDDEKKETKALWDTFLTIDIEQGEHNIKMYYMPQGFVIGLIMTMIGVILLFTIIIIKKPKQKIKNKKIIQK
ncbi:MAG: YfhO family protein [Eubacteriales bacterium]|nr:YfhO family protein [Eubacteriales bacterium]